MAERGDLCSPSKVKPQHTFPAQPRAPRASKWEMHPLSVGRLTPMLTSFLPASPENKVRSVTGQGSVPESKH